MSKNLTIIIPIYEYIEKLPSLIASINPRHCYIILIDDGSIENAQEIQMMFQYYNRFDHIKTIKSTHMGTWEIRKEALKYVETPYFTFADSDDLVFSDNLNFICQKMKQLDVPFGVGTVLLSMNGIPCGISRLRNQKNLEFANNPRDLGNLLNTVWSKIYHINLIPYFYFEQDVVVYEDTIAPYYLAMKAKNGYFSNLPVYYYQMRSNSNLYKFTNNLKTLGLENMYKASIYRKKAFMNAGEWEHYKEELESIDIRLFLQRVKSVYRDKRIQNPKNVSEVVLKMLTNLVPTWSENKYYQEGFKSAEINDTYNVLRARYFLRKNDMPLESFYYQNDLTLQNLSKEYARALAKK